MAVITWHPGNVPSNFEIKQVYGVVFTKDCRILLRIENGKYQLTGGKPEPFDSDMEATLRREMLEEANVAISKAYIVGYQLVDEEDGSEPYAQVRMTAMIENIGEQQPDQDNGRIYGRFLTTPTKAAKLLNWGEVRNKLIFEATEIIKQRFKINTISDDDSLIDCEVD
jgi:8-oxo-dGTP pyrophosphatase MutT (NUDIX family)